MNSNEFASHILTQDQSRSGVAYEPLAQTPSNVPEVAQTNQVQTNQEPKKKGGWPLWATIVIIIVSVVLVAGLIVLFMWLGGSFDPDFGDAIEEFVVDQFEDLEDNNGNGTNGANGGLPNIPIDGQQGMEVIENLIANNPDMTPAQIVNAVSTFITSRLGIPPVQDVLLGQLPIS